MSKVYANGRSVVHKGDGQVNTCAVPDVCKTPSPGGPVPVPYVNVARDGALSKGSTSVTLEGNPVALKDSNLGTSSGDEPGDSWNLPSTMAIPSTAHSPRMGGPASPMVMTALPWALATSVSSPRNRTGSMSTRPPRATHTPW
ncbi:PAAR-like domain-containing protein [Archangium sp.]|uniref:PAAR-like domain-containing protein n=1 Tax=Archangium sp. TaxID=1872627 RepID=UPI0039C883C0